MGSLLAPQSAVESTVNETFSIGDKSETPQRIIDIPLNSVLRLMKCHSDLISSPFHLVALFRDSYLVFLCGLLRKILNDFHKLHRKHPLLVTTPTNVPIIINLFNKHNLISCL